MAKVSVMAKIPAAPGKREELKGALQTLLDSAQGEAGTELYILSEDPNNADVLYMYEQYTDQSALEVHMGSEAFKSAGPGLAAFLGGRPELTFLSVVGGKGAEAPVATYLDKILAAHRANAALDGRALDDLIAAAQAMAAARGFRAALARAEGLAVIAEVKRRSPSKGALNADLDPADMARRYEAGGASCLSVLTDVDHFGGSPADLQAAREACSLPVLRKDFTVSARDVCDARLMGADCVLLIAAALDDAELAEFHALAIGIGLDVLVEIHDEPELDRALAVGATLIGVNQRDLVTFQVDHARAERMGSIMPAGVVRVAESGVRDGADARRLEAAGYHAVLVGETLVTSADPAATVRELRGI